MMMIYVTCDACRMPTKRYHSEVSSDESSASDVENSHRIKKSKRQAAPLPPPPMVPLLPNVTLDPPSMPSPACHRPFTPLQPLSDQLFLVSTVSSAQSMSPFLSVSSPLPVWSSFQPAGSSILHTSSPFLCDPDPSSIEPRSAVMPVQHVPYSVASSLSLPVPAEVLPHTSIASNPASSPFSHASALYATVSDSLILPDMSISSLNSSALLPLITDPLGTISSGFSLSFPSTSDRVQRGPMNDIVSTPVTTRIATGCNAVAHRPTALTGELWIIVVTINSRKTFLRLYFVHLNNCSYDHLVHKWEDTIIWPHCCKN